MQRSVCTAQDPTIRPHLPLTSLRPHLSTKNGDPSRLSKLSKLPRTTYTLAGACPSTYAKTGVRVPANSAGSQGGPDKSVGLRRNFGSKEDGLFGVGRSSEWCERCATRELNLMVPYSYFLASSDSSSAEGGDEAAKLVDLVLQALEAYPALNDSVQLTDPLTEAELQRRHTIHLSKLIVYSLYD